MRQDVKSKVARPGCAERLRAGHPERSEESGTRETIRSAWRSGARRMTTVLRSHGNVPIKGRIDWLRAIPAVCELELSPGPCYTAPFRREMFGYGDVLGHRRWRVYLLPQYFCSRRHRW